MKAAPSTKRIPRDVILFTTVYLGLAVIGILVTGNREFLFYILVMSILLAAVTAVHLRVGFSRGVLWGLSFWGLAHMAGGLVPVPANWPINGNIRVLYSWWLIPGLLKYDHVVHAYGFGVTTFVCWQGLNAAISRWVNNVPVFPTLGLLVICAAAATGFGALNEVVEFVAVLTIPNTNVGGYINTGWDLVSNLAGTTIAAVGIRLLYRDSDGSSKATEYEHLG